MSEHLSVADVLDRAADLIEPEGAWQQGGYGDGDLPTCMGGACNLARGLSAWNTPDVAPEARFLCKLLGEYTATWNDRPERTQAEVVAKLREAANLARARSAEFGNIGAEGVQS